MQRLMEKELESGQSEKTMTFGETMFLVSQEVRSSLKEMVRLLLYKLKNPL